MKRQTMMNQKHGQDERHFLQKMEEAALRDYKHKDIKSSRDFTAKLYNNEDLPDVPEKYEPIQRGPLQPSEGGQSLPSKPPDIGQRMYDKMAGKKKKTVDPMLEPTGDEPDRWDKDFEQGRRRRQWTPCWSRQAMSRTAGTKTLSRGTLTVSLRSSSQFRPQVMGPSITRSQ